ncbi:hypothetical protein JMJ77_0012059 [Colletotrichum scovillei]|uniref:Uncharacterized protein n=1 Tax=Colletotrichum scovillei TaxID=1209932 RepID=A0A9P7UAP2_9PEZI|nr:hypothetical protein JMJ77_0012059 [Colletotrichum scovillei]KAG7046344.1 hypothetical protein JMJ78_0011408 [Colletotrichum scovillei]KAG7063696.1 hypothetical protein JMJ76_0006155 [Colletotrichum scovillei]
MPKQISEQGLVDRCYLLGITQGAFVVSTSCTLKKHVFLSTIYLQQRLSIKSIKQTTKENNKDALETERRCVRVVGATGYELITNYGLRVRDNNTSGRVSERESEAAALLRIDK